MIPINDLKRGFELYEKEYKEKCIQILESGWYVLGNEVKSFEQEFADALGEGVEAVGVDNGLNAIHLGLLAAGITQGDEIIVQANGYIATMLGIIQCGAKPVFVEPDKFFNMDPLQIERVVTNRTKAVLVTHLYGQASRMDKITEICRCNNLMLFEDCAQSHFAKYKGQNTGTFGDAAFFSFYPTKNLGCFGDGGAVVSKNSELISKVRTLRNYGSDRRYHNIEVGFNSRLDEMQAGLLRVKLKHYDELIENRKHIADEYLVRIKNSKVEMPQLVNGATHIWYQFVVRVQNRTKFIEYMQNREIKTDVNWEVPPYLQPALEYLGKKRGDFPVTEKLCEEIVSLPMMDYMNEEEMDVVIDAVNHY